MARKDLTSITDGFYTNTEKAKKEPNYSKCTLMIDKDLIPYWHEMAYRERMGKSEYINHLIRQAVDDFKKSGGKLPE